MSANASLRTAFSTALSQWLLAFATTAAASVPPICAEAETTAGNGTTGEILCAEAPNGDARLSLQFGRGISTATGMLGHFDGFLVDYRLDGDTTLNAVAGYPALSSDDTFNADRQVFGIGATSHKFVGAWDLSSYLVEQQDQGRTESRAVGGAARYLQPERALLVSLDYDIGNSALGTLMISGAWKLAGLTTLSATLDLRQSYLRTPQERYFQQTLASTQGWKRALPMDRIKQLASDAPGGVKTLSLSLAHSFSNQLDLNGDLSVLHTRHDATGDSEDLGSGNATEYFWRLKLTSRNLISAGGQSSLDLRHNATAWSHTASAAVDTKYAIDRRWQLSPRLRTDYHNDQQANSQRWVAASGVRMEYRWKQDYALRFEAGGEWATERDDAGVDSRAAYFLKLGSQVQF